MKNEVLVLCLCTFKLDVFIPVPILGYEIRLIYQSFPNSELSKADIILSHMDILIL